VTDNYSVQLIAIDYVRYIQFPKLKNIIELGNPGNKTAIFRFDSKSERLFIYLPLSFERHCNRRQFFLQLAS